MELQPSSTIDLYFFFVSGSHTFKISKANNLCIKMKRNQGGRDLNKSKENTVTTCLGSTILSQCSMTECQMKIVSP